MPECPKVGGEIKALQAAGARGAEGPMEGKGGQSRRALPAVLEGWALRSRSTGSRQGHTLGWGWGVGQEVIAQCRPSDRSLLPQQGRDTGCR